MDIMLLGEIVLGQLNSISLSADGGAVLTDDVLLRCVDATSADTVRLVLHTDTLFVTILIVVKQP